MAGRQPRPQPPDETEMPPPVRQQTSKKDEMPPPADTVEPKGKIATGIMYLKKINTEPALLLFAFQMGIMQACLTAFVYWRNCVDTFQEQEGAGNVDYCKTLTSNREAQIVVASKTSTFTQWQSLATCLPALIVSPIICAWSDTAGGRKRPLLVALACVVVSQVFMIWVTADGRASIYWILLGFVVQSVGGGGMVTFAMVFASITDEVRLKGGGPGGPGPPPGGNKDDGPPAPDEGGPSGKDQPPPPPPGGEEGKILSIRIGFASAAMMMGTVFGSLIGGAILEGNDTYSYPFLASEIAAMIGFFYSMFIGRETHFPKADKELHKLKSHEKRAKKRKEILLKLIKGVWLKLKEAWHALAARRFGNKRKCLWIGLLVNFSQMCLSMGVQMLILLYAKGPKLGWTDAQYGYFQAYVNLMSSIGMTCVPILMNKIPKLKDMESKDTITVMIGTTGSAIFFLIIGFSSKTWHLYVAGAFMLLGNLFLPGFRSFFSKIVGQAETARIFAAVGILENLTPLIASVIFNNIYNASLKFNFAGFTFLLASGLHIFVLMGTLFIHFLMLKDATAEAELRAQGIDPDSTVHPTVSAASSGETNIGLELDNDSVPPPNR